MSRPITTRRRVVLWFERNPFLAGLLVGLILLAFTDHACGGEANDALPLFSSAALDMATAKYAEDAPGTHEANILMAAGGELSWSKAVTIKMAATTGIYLIVRHLRATNRHFAASLSKWLVVGMNLAVTAYQLHLGYTHRKRDY